MTLSCKVIQDLLPLYHDGVCSGESAQLVREHLTQCKDCSAMLESLKGEIDAAYTTANEVKPLEDIKKFIRKGKRRAVGKGMLAAVALILVMALIGSGIWYNRIGKYYAAVADKMEPITKQMASMSSATHYLEAGEYGVILQKPMVFSDSGFIRVGSIDQTVNYLKGIYHEEAWNKEVSLDLFFYPDEEGGYQFGLNFTHKVFDEEAALDGYQHGWYWVNPDLSLQFSNLREQEQFSTLLAEYRPEIEALFALVEEQFGISYLE